MSRLTDTQVVFGKNSDRGRSREHNEDSCDLFRTTVLAEDNPSIKRKAVVAVVADGIGGAVGGKEASRIAVSTIKKVMQDERALNHPVSRRLEDAIVLANKAIVNRARANPQLSGMGTTVVVAVIADNGSAGNRLYVSHAGDSRAYLVRQGAIYQLTVDHSWVQEAIAAGRLTPEQAAHHPNRNVVKRYLGIHETVKVDHGIIDISRFKGVKGSPPIVQSLKLQPSDVVMLCSDGLTDMVTDNDILAIIKNNEDYPQDAADELINAANAKGGRDNITAVLVALRGENKSRLPSRVWLGRTLMIFAALVVLFLFRTAYTYFFPGYEGEDKIEITLLEPEAGTTKRASSVEFQVMVIGNLENDELQLNIITNQGGLPIINNRLEPVEEERNLYSILLDKPPDGFGKDYYWTVELRGTTDKFVYKAPTAHKLRWEEPAAAKAEDVTITLLDPKVLTNTTSVQFQVQVIGKQESDRLVLKIGAEPPLVRSTNEWQPVGQNLYATSLKNIPDGFGQDYYWTVVLIRQDGTAEPASELRWEKASESEPTPPPTNTPTP